jgi:hypothetical protein
MNYSFDFPRIYNEMLQEHNARIYTSVDNKNK